MLCLAEFFRKEETFLGSTTVMAVEQGNQGDDDDI